MATYLFNAATTHHSEFGVSEVQITCRYFPLFTGHAWASFNSMMQYRIHDLQQFTIYSQLEELLLFYFHKKI